MTKANVLLIVHLHTAGGTELSTLTLASGLKQAGHKVHVMCNDNPIVNEFRNRGIDIISARMHRNITSLLKDGLKLRKFIVQNKIEIVHYQSAFYMVMSLLSLWTIKSNRVQAVWTCRGISKMGYFIVGHFSRFLVDFVIANCEAEKNKLIRHGLSAQKIRTIYNSPNVTVPENTGKNRELLNELGIDLDTQVVGTVSRLSPERGVKYFIEAASIISQQTPNVVFVIVGEGEEEKNLRQQAKKLNIEQQVMFLGRRRDMERVYSIMDIFVNPLVPTYDAAGTGNANAEAMTFAKPVIATNVSGTSEIVQNGVTGVLVPPGDSQKIAESLLTLLRHRELAEKMGLAGRERIEKHFTLDRLIKEVEEVYSSLME